MPTTPIVARPGEPPISTTPISFAAPIDLDRPARSGSEPALARSIATRTDAHNEAAPAFALSLQGTPQALAKLLTSQDLLGLIGHLRRDLDELREQWQQANQHRHAAIAGGALLSGGLAVGYVVWLVRGGALVGSMLSALPAWQLIDPLPVLARARRVDEPAPDDDAERDSEQLEALFDATRPTPKPPPPPVPTHAGAAPREPDA